MRYVYGIADYLREKDIDAILADGTWRMVGESTEGAGTEGAGTEGKCGPALRNQHGECPLGMLPFSGGYDHIPSPEKVADYLMMWHKGRRCSWTVYRAAASEFIRAVDEGEIGVAGLAGSLARRGKQAGKNI
jgi:hypothetical protein